MRSSHNWEALTLAGIKARSALKRQPTTRLTSGHGLYLLGLPGSFLPRLCLQPHPDTSPPAPQPIEVGREEGGRRTVEDKSR